MNIAGIVCEYNPMHGGHIYQIEKTRELLGADTAIICIMSGNFVQRGDFAVFDKFKRAKAALLSGADLVIELPLPWSISSAESFAGGAVHILNGLHVATHISFGSETGDADPLVKIAETLLDPNLDNIIKDELSSGVSYASARQKAVNMLIGDESELLSMPNNILATEYIKTLINEKSNIEPLCILRKGTSHDGEGNESSSFIREWLRRGQNIGDFVPKNIAEVFADEIKKGRGPVFYDIAEMSIMYKLRSMSEKEYENLPYGNEGLCMRLKNAANSENTLRDVLEAVKTKRYTYARVRRMAMCGYLGITKADLEGLPPYARVLGMNKTGKMLLSMMKERTSIPVITKPAAVRDLDEYAQYIFGINSKATNIYNLMYKDAKDRGADTDYRTTPVIL